jgi:ABC-2 type transport system permease protein
VNDIVTIVTKELKEFSKARGGRRSRILSFLLIVLLFCVLWPLEGRQAWAEVSFLPGILFMLLPLSLAGGTTADSFAGERERYTLETLLSTRLADRDIFLGKVLATVIYCVAFVWVCAGVALVTLNVTRGARPFFMYSGISIALIVVGAVLLSFLMTAIGVLVSLRASSVVAAALGFSLMTLALFIVVPLLIQVLPHSAKAALGRALLTADFTLVGIVAGLAVLALDLALLAVGIARFQRTRLILE